MSACSFPVTDTSGDPCLWCPDLCGAPARRCVAWKAVPGLIRRGEEGEGGLGKRFFFFRVRWGAFLLATHARDPSERSPEKEDTTPEGHLYYWRASTAYCVLRTRSCVQYAVLDLLLLACSSCVFVFFGRILLLPVPDLCCAAGLAGRLPVRLPRG